MGFLLPVLLVLVINFVAYIFILRSLLTSGINLSKVHKASGITQIRRALSILVLLGLTWLFGVLAIGDAKLVFQYLFCIFNSLQGLLVFIFYCVLSKDARRQWRSLCSGRKTTKQFTLPNTGHRLNVLEIRSCPTNSESANHKSSSTNHAMSSMNHLAS